MLSSGNLYALSRIWVGLLLLSSALLTGCATPAKTIEFPLLEGWYEGEQVFYITTDVSDLEMAYEMKANYAPRLVNAVPQYPKPPQVKTVLERVYGFPGGEQTASVFASAPGPLGFESRDGVYSPLWLMYIVEWQPGTSVKTLRSEQDIFNAEEAGLVTISRTDIVINCPIVSLADGTRLPAALR